MSSIKDILADPPPEPPPVESKPPPPPAEVPTKDTPPPEPAPGDEDTSPKEPVYTSTTTSTRRNASGSVSSVYSGNKMKHLKKEDGIPLWRKDIQYDFLRLVFYNDTRCFTKYSDGTTGHTFAEIYIDAMAKSSKCSKILKEKLLQDTDGRIGMAMVCLLVNVGRMNTTLNFFPEMRAQLRTYHSIPALQAQQDPNAYKQLQDAPRLKSILKGATEDEPQPSTIEDIKAAKIPRTNAVNLIFVMSQYAPKISEVHFQPPRDFFDLVMRSTLSSQSRARAFLWLLWWYLESDFSYEDSQRNPFGPGQYMEGEKESGVLPLKVPTLESLTEEQAAAENVDTEEEQYFGEVKRKERITILASEPSPAMTALKRARKEKGLVPAGSGLALPSDDEMSDSEYWRNEPARAGIANLRRSMLYHDTASEYTRSPSPAGNRAQHTYAPDMKINSLLNNDDAISETSPPRVASGSGTKKGPGRGNWRRGRAKPGAASDRAPPVPLLPNTNSLNFVNEQPSTPRGQHSNPLDGPHVPTPSYQAQKRGRGVTQHQSAVINHRKQQIDYNLDRRIRKLHIRARDKREIEGSLLRAWQRIRAMPVDYDSEEEAIKMRKARERVEKDEDWRSQPKGKENLDAIDDADAWMRSRVLYAGFVRAPSEPNDVGEELRGMAGALRKCARRLERWNDSNAPGDAILRRQRLATGLEDGVAGGKRRKLRKEPSMDEDGLEIVQNHRVSNSRKSRTSSSGKRRVEEEMREESKIDFDEDGAAELDEEDRELLGEVDADESEDDQEDEEMGGY